MTTFDELNRIATKKERAYCRRLVKLSGYSYENALYIALQKSAGEISLDSLVLARTLEKSRLTSLLNERQFNRNQKTAETGKATKDCKNAWQAWFDGSAQPNPGKIGIGGLLVSPTGERHQIALAKGTGDSNEAEYLALIAVLELALSFTSAKLLVFGDSRVIIDDVKSDLHERARRGAQGLQEYRARVKNLIERFDSIELAWIPRHRNAEADILSRQALIKENPL